MKIGIIDADLLDNGTKHPNLALMKLSGYNKELGHSVQLIESYDGLKIEDYDHIYISKVFNYSKIDENILRWDNVSFGGTGFFTDGGENLQDEIEHHKPDYSLYNQFISHQIDKGYKRSYYADYLDYSIGFATRGCFRKCDFCVNKKYDNVQFHSHISEWFDPSRKGIYLWDDNIFAYSHWRDVFKELNETEKRFQFRQGIDIRLLNPAKAKALAESRYIGDYIFAFDYIEDRKVIENKLKLWRKNCNKPTKLYLLCGFESQDLNDIVNTFERIKIVFKYGCWPYIMRHEYYKRSEYKDLYVQLARWCNQPQFIKKLSFRQYCERNQYYHKTKGTLCASMRALTYFEDKHPSIAKEYYDMRFNDQDYDIKRKAHEA